MTLIVHIFQRTTAELRLRTMPGAKIMKTSDGLINHPELGSMTLQVLLRMLGGCLWLWVYYNEIPIDPIFYLLKGD